ncbi:hypothetical protein ZYGR_0A03050 [Zygosaccharomyces rouxii]|uniref:ZYRO0A06952p n=2 Tax=Zygosaccharomyces rouxii TaxID=4956 RepID=C5DPX6_ZYGRC|nr:uncharacterized protein ZYRO0A06952g [Zygosaccharomyces rouxii]KAH9198742.1 hypothetical protein LQ764DRAFT_211142 [Zygosaccharomyces rouxii]GAV46711.1 hypothetical protein ZYGR_0A03050 [Zygosaccharomyces rouxii]CAR25737.1 ZYRO0A06952p [Zygosaccharomyces rouxii]
MNSNIQGPQRSYTDGSRFDNESPVLPILDFNTSKINTPIQLLPINVVLPELKYWQEQFSNTSEEDIWKRRNLRFQQRHQLKPLIRPNRRQDRTPHLKRDSKLSTETKMSNFGEYIKDMKSHGHTQILMRTRVITELGITRAKLQSPTLIMNNWGGTMNSIQVQTRALSLGQETFRTEHALSCQRTTRDQVIELHFGPVSQSPADYQFAVYSTAVRQPHGGYRWFHYVKGATYVNLAIFLLGSDFNYSINDNLVEPTIGNDLKVISAKKRCISRLRSHAKSSMIANPCPGNNDTGGSIMEIQHVHPKLYKLLHHHTFLQL